MLDEVRVCEPWRPFGSGSVQSFKILETRLTEAAASGLPGLPSVPTKHIMKAYLNRFEQCYASVSSSRCISLKRQPLAWDSDGRTLQQLGTSYCTRPVLSAIAAALSRATTPIGYQ